MSVPVVLGIDFGGTKVALAVCEGDGTRLAAVTIATRAAEGASTVFSRTVAAARELLSGAAPGRLLAAVGASTFGIPGPGGVALAPAVPGWGDLALAGELGAAFPGTAVHVVTDVKAAAGIEAASGALTGSDPGLYLNLGTGLAVAIVAGGVVVNGRNGASGEIGYNLRTAEDVGASVRVPLEDAVSGRALTGAVRPHAIDTAFTSGDPHVTGTLAAFTRELAFHLVNLTIALDPARIAVGGGMTRSWHHLHDGLRHALDTAVPYPPELVRARYPYDGPLRGALALALAATPSMAERNAR